MGFNFKGGIIVHLPNYKRWGWFANPKKGYQALCTF